MKLSELVSTKKISVRTAGVELEMRTDITWAEWVELLGIEDPVERGAAQYAKLIVSWNIQGEDGAPLPITPGNVRALPRSIAEDVIVAWDEMKRAREEKKTS